MCGILGFNLRRSLNPSDVEKGLKHLSSLSHRGPDGQGHSAFNEQGVFIGHRRLAILDISDRASQPMSRAGLTLAHNGEIYNFIELRRELEKAGGSFTTESDTEVLLSAWRERGADCLNDLDGMFAFALFDGEVTNLAVDPFGEKPLYVIESDEGVYYASEPAPLIEMLGLKFEPTEQEVASFLTLGFIPSPGTGFGKLRLLEPGTHLVIKNGEIVRSSKYWTADVPVLWEGTPRPVSESELDDVAQALIDSTRVRLRSDVPTSIFLSSGVDSALVAAIIAKELKADVPAITVGFPGVDVADESEGAEAIARYLGIGHQVITSDGTGGSDPFDLLMSIYGCANDNVTAIPVYEMARTARASATVALSGIGGDELFYGYNKYRVFHERKRLLSYGGPMRTAARLLYKINDRRTGSYVSQLIRRTGRWTYANLKNVDAWDILEMVPGLDSWGDEFFSDYNSPQYVAGRHFDLTQVLPGLYIPAVERASMRVGLEVRTPYLNKKLFSVVDGLDPRSMVGFGQKSIARRLLGRYLPEELIFSGKRGFNSPLGPIVKSQKESPQIPWIGEELVAAAMDRRSTGRGGHLFVRMMILSRLAAAN
jgi:asparagine synthase (glutamine-hydrolysing)